MTLGTHLASQSASASGRLPKQVHVPKGTGLDRGYTNYAFRAALALVAAALFISTSVARADTAQAPAAPATPPAASAPASGAPAGEPAGPTPRLVRPGDMTSGALLLQSTQEGKYVQAPILATDVEIDVTGPIARTKVTQRFENPGDGWIEGVYVFPLPENAAVDTLRMQIGDRFIEGVIKEREEARQIYEEARAAGKKASLIEQERPNLFTNSVANIGPNETVIVQIEYQETARLDDGVFSLRFPMVVAPRYNPKPTVHMVSFDEQGAWGVVEDPVPDRERIEAPVLDPRKIPEGKIVNPLALSVSLEAGFPLGDVTSPHHEIVMTRNGDGRASLSLKEGEVPANKDFELTWAPKPGKTPSAALFRETVDGEDYVLVMVTPPEGSSAPDPRPRETIFVIDNSGSMGGESIRQAKASLLMALDRLDRDDKFNIVRFDDTYEVVFPVAVPADQENIAIAKKFVSGLDAEGGTEMLPALKAALQDPNPADTSRVRQVIFLTDGAIGNEEQLFEEIARNRGRSRLFTVGIGSAPNSFFMSRAAEQGRGTFTHIGNLDQVQDRMSELFTKLENPVMTELNAEWPDGVLLEAWPNPLPDLYKGEPIIVSGRLEEADGTLKISGMLAGQPWQVQLPLDKGEIRPGIAKLWARKKIASLEGLRYSSGDWEKLDEMILETALAHHLVSRKTSLVAVDVTPSRPVGENLANVEVPLNLPEGWDFDKVFGEPVPAVREASADTGAPFEREAQAMAPLIKLAAAPKPAPDPATRGLMLPQGATDAPQMIVTGLISLLLAATLLVVRLFWGHLAAGFAQNGPRNRRPL